LTINLIRFEWRNKKGTKILKQIKFPMIIDVYDLCSDDLKKKKIKTK